MVSKAAAEANRLKKLFALERRKFQRALPKAIKTAAKGSGWRTSQGVLFRESDGWFVEVHAIPWVVEPKTPAHLHCKPMALDPLFWKIVHLDENVEQPLSFRVFGAFTCRTPPLLETDIPEEGGSLQRTAQNLADWANSQLPALRKTQTINAFVEFLQTYPSIADSHLPALVTGLLLQGMDQEALALCKKTTGMGGFLFSGGEKTKSFVDLAIEWIIGAGPLRVVK